MSSITYTEWFDTYKPIINQMANDNTYPFETYSPDVDFVREQPEENIWTELDGDEGVYIVSGFHFVNRIQYYVTEKPWTEDTVITVCIYTECENNIEGECEPDCDKCGGDGVITEWSN